MKTIWAMLILFVACANAATFYVSPVGDAGNSGQYNSPINLASVLDGSKGTAGDTFILRYGVYSLGHTNSTIAGTSDAPITIRAFRGERATIDGSITWWNGAGYLTIQDLEIMVSDTNRISTGTGYTVPDINKQCGFNIYGPGIKVVNCVFHDHIGAGIFKGNGGEGGEIYGNVFYNNGYESSDTSDGHDLYLQNSNILCRVENNICGNGFATPFHAYRETAGGFGDFHIEGNTFYNGGIYAHYGTHSTFLLGEDGATTTCSNVTIISNFVYSVSPIPDHGLGPAQVGRAGTNNGLACAWNVFPDGIYIQNWDTGSFVSNIVGATGNMVKHLSDIVAIPTWNYNDYHSRNSASTPFWIVNGSVNQTYNWANWKTQSGFDANSTYTAGAFSGTTTYLRTNKYDRGRANVTIYNWDLASTIDVDLSSFVTPGHYFEVRNAQNYYGRPVSFGIYSGGSVTLPMIGLTVAKPNGVASAVATTSPQFAVFVVVSMLPPQIGMGAGG